MSTAVTEDVLPKEVNTVEQISIKNPSICRYFLLGNCRFGVLCRFSHDLTNIDKTTTTTTTKSESAKIDEETNIDMKPSTSKNWIDAPIFVPYKDYHGRSADENKEEEVEEEEGAAAIVPSNYTWSEVLTGGDMNGACSISSLNSNMQYMNLNGNGGAAGIDMGIGPSAHLANELCPFMPPCPYMHHCAYGLHMHLCDMCDQYCLHPTDTEQRRKHNQQCLEQHEKDMELSFAIARSKDKTCGICFETIIEKAGREKRFGILPNCNHIFCLECIRKWRQATQFEHKIIRSCPECRVCSDFVCPSAFWVDTKEDKTKLLADYRSALGVKDCKYFKKGEGKCPFANKCFYKHALPNGENVDLGNPKRQRKVRRNSSEIVDLLDVMNILFKIIYKLFIFPIIFLSF